MYHRLRDAFKCSPLGFMTRYQSNSSEFTRCVCWPAGKGREYAADGCRQPNPAGWEVNTARLKKKKKRRLKVAAINYCERGC